jgi:hypothetical protein
MVDQTTEIIFIAIYLIIKVGFWLFLGHKLFEDSCGRSCGQKSSGPDLDKPEAKIYVTEETSETTESHQEGQTFTTVFLLKDKYIV